MKKWKMLSTEDIGSIDDVINQLLKNRNINEKDQEFFFKPTLKAVTLESVGLSRKEFGNFKKRIDKSIKNNEKTIIFGDYDVDGICGTAIIWETLYSKSKNYYPFIPDRADEGYGLSIKGIDSVLQKHPDTKIIITVDNGIVAYEAIDYAISLGLEVIVTDHHQAGTKKNNASIVLHTTSLCGAGIAWILARELKHESEKDINEKLELAMLATIADLVPLVNASRVIVTEGLELIKNTKRIGLQEILKESKIKKDEIGVYQVGHIISPRLNASGRIDKAINALRLLCTKNREKAKQYALMLGSINRERQTLTEEAVTHAKMSTIVNSHSERIIIVSHKSYNAGIIGIVASQMVESYYKPSFAISIGDEISKGSARSIKGINIIELLRSVSDYLIETGGHPMAAGFSVYTEKLEEFYEALSKKAEKIVTDEVLERYVNIDMVLPFSLISKKLIQEIRKFEPFGIGNPEPVFASDKVKVIEIRKLGKEHKHLKIKIEKDGKIFDAIGFNVADIYNIDQGDIISIAYTIDENEWNGEKTIQLKLRDIKN